MPSQTFFNLPKEKQDRIMAAAREEFFTHSFDEASINRLIKAAGIPRGSFYQYFADKEDVYFYLGDQISQRMIEGARKELAACGYDPFSLAREVLPQWLDEIFYGENAAFFYRKIDMLHSQQVPRPKQAEDPLSCLSAQEISGLTAKVALQDRTDLKFLLHSLLLAFISCLSEGAEDYEAGRPVDTAKLTQVLDRRLSYLENGFKKKAD
ncbi:TetR/AcrR family transcriptional regulator [Lactobacillus delbrueckii subsp. delbrueckii]|uniref:TetR/AcrR family transcriptional regulator n=1 Tax=Lactobacillus delbrueckii subsp. delbrueckii TaxID=83684 RepID=A0AAU9R6I0_9LACO|nr:TetR/AcrR family transcriptional regulator [Lactobacillus delbrueckii]MCT4392110.1 TetR/AcrR family transcriptional regulator [Lactobacillus delbrueckii]CAH1707060.1 TetR/AcrR family transcriptional regulator [Lactobacillus delbrueckii subsp. delbrueckii]